MKIFVGYAVYSETTKKFIHRDIDTGYQWESSLPENFLTFNIALQSANPETLKHLGVNSNTYKVVKLFAESCDEIMLNCVEGGVSK